MVFRLYVFLRSSRPFNAFPTAQARIAVRSFAFPSAVAFFSLFSLVPLPSDAVPLLFRPSFRDDMQVSTLVAAAPLRALVLASFTGGAFTYVRAIFLINFFSIHLRWRTERQKWRV